jgi:hypothetical protein
MFVFSLQIFNLAQMVIIHNKMQSKIAIVNNKMEN